MNIENREAEGGILTVSIGVAIAERLEPSRKSEIMRLANPYMRRKSKEKTGR